MKPKCNKRIDSLPIDWTNHPSIISSLINWKSVSQIFWRDHKYFCESSPRWERKQKVYQIIILSSHILFQLWTRWTFVFWNSCEKLNQSPLYRRSWAKIKPHLSEVPRQINVKIFANLTEIIFVKIKLWFVSSLYISQILINSIFSMQTPELSGVGSKRILTFHGIIT